MSKMISVGINTAHQHTTCRIQHIQTLAHACTHTGFEMVVCCLCSPVLTWRDVQHIIVKTSRAGHLNAPDWKTNAAGYNGENTRVGLEWQSFTFYEI